MFKIFEAPKKKETEVFLRLVPGADKRVVLALVDKNGEVIHRGNLMDFNLDGTFSRRWGVTETKGIKVLNGKIKERQVT